MPEKVIPGIEKIKPLVLKTSLAKK